MSADNAWFIYLDRGDWWRVKHGFASHIPDLSPGELEIEFADAWGSQDYAEAIEYAQDQVSREDICEYRVWILNGVESDVVDQFDDDLVHPDKWWEH